MHMRKASKSQVQGYYLTSLRPTLHYKSQYTIASPAKDIEFHFQNHTAQKYKHRQSYLILKRQRSIIFEKYNKLFTIHHPEEKCK